MQNNFYFILYKASTYYSNFDTYARLQLSERFLISSTLMFFYSSENKIRGKLYYFHIQRIGSKALNGNTS